jgi:transcriptional regulator with XRE-family HTH domain
MTDGGKGKVELARALRAHRKAKRITGAQLAERLGVRQGTISKLENGRLPPTIDFLSKFAHALRLGRDQTEELIRLAGVVPGESNTTDFLRFLPYDFLNVDWSARRQRSFAASERAADTIRGYQPLFVPGLLQTESYARRVLTLAGITNPQQLERAVRTRVRRQRVLMDRGKRFLFLLTDGALRALIGTSRERDEQVRHLVELAQRSNVRIGLIPSERPPRVIPPPPFYVFDGDRVYIELPHGDLWLLEPSHAGGFYLDIFNRLGDSAVFGEALILKLEQVRRRFAA